MKKLMALALSVVFIVPVAWAQQYPSRPIEVVVPWSGGDTDLIARMAAEGASRYLGQPLVVINKPGGQGIVGTELVARAPADGYTLLVNGPAHLIVPMVSVTPFSADDFIPIAQLSKSKAIVVVKADAPWKTIKEFAEDARTRPNQILYGWPGPGAWHSIKWQTLMDKGRMKLSPVPFTGNAPIVMALLGGHIQAALIEKPTIISHIRAGTVRPLAIAEPDPDLPSVPTFESQGFPGDYNNVRTVYVRKGTPAEILDSLTKAFQQMLASPEYAAALSKVGSVPGRLTGAELAQYLEQERRGYEAILQELGVRRR